MNVIIPPLSHPTPFWQHVYRFCMQQQSNTQTYPNRVCNVLQPSNTEERNHQPPHPPTQNKILKDK